MAGAGAVAPAIVGATAIRVQSPGTSRNFGTCTDSVITCRTCPRLIRSARSGGPSSVDVGMITAPSFIAARMVSQSGAMLPSMSSSRSPRRTPASRSQLAT